MKWLREENTHSKVIGVLGPTEKNIILKKS